MLSEYKCRLHYSGVIGGGITFISFKPCCNRLKVVLQDIMLSNPEHISAEDEDQFVNSVI